MICGLWLLLIGVATWRVVAFLFGIGFQKRKWGDGSGEQRPAVLILPVKGIDPKATPAFFDAIFSQEYSSYRVIVAFEHWQDPVAMWLCAQLNLSARSPVWESPDAQHGPESITLVAAGRAVRRGQKVHNQLAAMEELRPGDRIVAFADADIQCGRDWLARLAAPINCGTHPLSTTYRWLVPRRPTIPNQLASVINASITTQGGAELTTVLWGGSMAVERGVFDSLDVPKLFEGSLNDDLRLSKEARRKGHRIAFVRSLVLPTTIDFGWAGFFEFARRQYTQVKIFSPILYTGVNIVLGFYVLGLSTAIAGIVLGHFTAWIPIAAAYLVDQFRAMLRQRIYFKLFRDSVIRRRLADTAYLEHMLTPFWMVLHWCLLVSTWFKSRIVWAGVHYRILSPTRTRIAGRREEPTPPLLPRGMPHLVLHRMALHAASPSPTAASAALLGAPSGSGESSPSWNRGPAITPLPPASSLARETPPESASPEPFPVPPDAPVPAGQEPGTPDPEDSEIAKSARSSLEKARAILDSIDGPPARAPAVAEPAIARDAPCPTPASPRVPLALAERLRQKRDKRRTNARAAHRKARPPRPAPASPHAEHRQQRSVPEKRAPLADALGLRLPRIPAPPASAASSASPPGPRSPVPPPAGPKPPQADHAPIVSRPLLRTRKVRAPFPSLRRRETRRSHPLRRKSATPPPLATSLGLRPLPAPTHPATAALPARSAALPAPTPSPLPRAKSKPVPWNHRPLPPLPHRPSRDSLRQFPSLQRNSAVRRVKRRTLPTPTRPRASALKTFPCLRKKRR